MCSCTVLPRPAPTHAPCTLCIVGMPSNVAAAEHLAPCSTRAQARPLGWRSSPDNCPTHHSSPGSQRQHSLHCNACTCIRQQLPSPASFPPRGWLAPRGPAYSQPVSIRVARVLTVLTVLSCAAAWGWTAMRLCATHRPLFTPHPCTLLLLEPLLLFCIQALHRSLRLHVLVGVFLLHVALLPLRHSPVIPACHSAPLHLSLLVAAAVAIPLLADHLLKPQRWFRCRGPREPAFLNLLRFGGGCSLAFSLVMASLRASSCCNRGLQRMECGSGGGGGPSAATCPASDPQPPWSSSSRSSSVHRSRPTPSERRGR